MPLVRIPVESATSRRVVMADSFTQANALIFCHGRACQRKGTSRVWQCRHAAEFSQMGNTVQDQNLLKSVLDRVGHQGETIRCWTVDNHAGTNPHEIMDVTDNQKLDQLFERMRATTATMKYVVFMNCPVMGTRAAHPTEIERDPRASHDIIMDFASMWLVMQRCFAFFRSQRVRGWRIVVTNFFMSFNTLLLHSIVALGIVHSTNALLRRGTLVLTESSPDLYEDFMQDLFNRFSTAAEPRHKKQYINDTHRKHTYVQSIAHYLHAYIRLTQRAATGHAVPHPVAVRKENNKRWNNGKDASLLHPLPIESTVISILQHLSIPTNVVVAEQPQHAPRGTGKARAKPTRTAKKPKSKREELRIRRFHTMYQRARGANSSKHFSVTESKSKSSPALFTPPRMTPLYIPDASWTIQHETTHASVIRGHHLGMVFQ